MSSTITSRISRFVKTSAVTLCAATFTFAGAATAEDLLLSYNYADLNYFHTFYDEPGIESGNGVELGASISPVENFFFDLSYTYEDTGIDNIDLDIDLHEFHYGVGAYAEIAEQLHAVARFGGIHREADIEGPGNADEDAYYLSAALRAAVCDYFEVKAEAKFIDGTEDNGWIYGLTSVIPVADQVGINAGVLIDDDSNTRLVAGLRAAF